MSRQEERKQAAQQRYDGESQYQVAKAQAFLTGARWADKTLIEKAYKWIKENFGNYIGADVSEYDIHDDEFADDFRKAMEE